MVVEKNAQKTDRFLTTTLYRFSKISLEIQKDGICAEELMISALVSSVSVADSGVNYRYAR